jgi:predicted Rossmann-fold nucleotide-binding protein
VTTSRPLIAVIGSGQHPHNKWSDPLGRWLAENGCDLINGGGPGVMEATAQAFSRIHGREGQVFGVLPSTGDCSSMEGRQNYKSPAGYPNGFVDRVIRTHLPLSGSLGKDTASRNHIIILSADYVVALPGGPGTRSEIELALDYGKPMMIANAQGEWNEFSNKGVAMAQSVEEVLAWLAEKTQDF